MTTSFKQERLDHTRDIIEFLRSTYQKAESLHIYIPQECGLVPERYQKTHRPTPGEQIIGIVIKNDQMGHKNFAGKTPPLSALHMMFELAMIQPYAALDAGLNWPDDVVVQHKAISTLFTELIIEQGKVVGILAVVTMHLNNVYAYSNEYYHTNVSASVIEDKEIDEKTYIDSFLKQLEKLYSVWESKQYPQLYDQWKDKQVYLNDTITFYHNIGMVMRGQILDFLPNGDMILHDENGKNHTLHYLQTQDSSQKK